VPHSPSRAAAARLRVGTARATEKPGGSGSGSGRRRSTGRIRPRAPIPGTGRPRRGCARTSRSSARGARSRAPSRPTGSSRACARRSSSSGRPRSPRALRTARGRLHWPRPRVVDPPFPAGGRYPTTPTLVLNGDLDLRTDLYQARAPAEQPRGGAQHRPHDGALRPRHVRVVDRPRFRRDSCEGRHRLSLADPRAPDRAGRRARRARRSR
jgi:hypothetical protein